jgi:hypothetical protein
MNGLSRTGSYGNGGIRPKCQGGEIYPVIIGDSPGYYRRNQIHRDMPISSVSKFRNVYEKVAQESTLISRLLVGSTNTTLEEAKDRSKGMCEVTIQETRSR